MFGFGKPETSGSDDIQSAISQFDDIAERLEAGVSKNVAAIADNNQSIAALKQMNDTLQAVSARGASVASKLRQLMS